MMAGEIRALPVAPSHKESHNTERFLQEIAAQLADLNATLRAELEGKKK